MTEFDEDIITEKIEPVSVSSSLIDYCPRCEKGYSYYIDWNNCCKECGYPGMLNKEE